MSAKKKLQVNFLFGNHDPLSLLHQAYVVLGQFLVLKKEEELFRDWLLDTCGANKKQQSDCFTCLKEWCNAFL